MLSHSAEIKMDGVERIAVVCQEPEKVKGLLRAIEALGCQSSVVTDSPLNSSDILAERLACQAQAVVCSLTNIEASSHEVSEQRLVARLYDLGVPTLLRDNTRRPNSALRWIDREKIPVLIRGGRVSPWEIRDGIERCRRELAGDWAWDRRAYLNIVRVSDMIKVETDGMIGVVVPGRDLHETLWLPLSKLEDCVSRGDLEVGTRLVAKVNTGAALPEEVYFTDFALPDSTAGG